MNELMIHELMIEIERIVRPISATQGRKLRMRQELLAHLQAAMNEERERFPNDDRAAMEQAKMRLGEPAELTNTLQQTVPTVERLLLSKLPMSARIEHLERRLARVPGQLGPMTLGHKMILLAMAMLVIAPCWFFATGVVTRGVPAKHLLMALVGCNAILLAVMLATFRFVYTAARSEVRQDRFRTLYQAALVLVLQTIFAFVFAFSVADHVPAVNQVVTCMGLAVALLAIAAIVARRISLLRRRYDEWLTLEIA